MPRARGDRRENGPLWWLMFVATIVAVYVFAIAVGTSDKCGERLNSAKEWHWFPPEWECLE